MPIPAPAEIRTLLQFDQSFADNDFDTVLNRRAAIIVRALQAAGFKTDCIIYDHEILVTVTGGDLSDEYAISLPCEF